MMKLIKNLNGKKILSVILQLILLLSVYLGIKIYTQRDLVSDTPPALSATLLSGQSFNLSKYHTNKPLLLHFWATWCPVCKFEQDSIESLSHDYTVVSIAMQSGDVTILKRYMQAENLTFSVIADEDGQLAARYGVKAVPVSFILNSRGEIVFSEAGYTTGWGLRLRLWLAQYL